MPTGDPAVVKVGPGWVSIAPLDTTEPTDASTLIEDVDAAWTNLGYTEGGTTFVFDQTFENVTVDQELDPIATLQTARQVTINVAAAEMLAANLETAFNGGDVVGPTGGLTTFEPPDTGVFTHVMLVWQSFDLDELWLFRKVLQIGNVEIARKKAPDKATIPLSFRALKPTGAKAFQAFLFDESAGS